MYEVSISGRAEDLGWEEILQMIFYSYWKYCVQGRQNYMALLAFWKICSFITKFLRSGALDCVNLKSTSKGSQNETRNALFWVGPVGKWRAPWLKMIKIRCFLKGKEWPDQSSSIHRETWSRGFSEKKLSRIKVLFSTASGKNLAVIEFLRNRLLSVKWPKLT